MTDNTPETPSDTPSDTPSRVPDDVTPSTPPAEGTVPPPEQGYAPPPPAGYAPPPGYATPPPPAPGYGAPQYGAPQGAYPPQYAAAPLTDADQRTWAVVAHLGTLISAILAPLIVWLVFKGRGAFVEDQAKESLNFQISFAIASVILSIFGIITVGFGFLLFIPLAIAWLVFIIIAAVQASQGVRYRYPVTYRFIK